MFNALKSLTEKMWGEEQGIHPRLKDDQLFLRLLYDNLENPSNLKVAKNETYIAEQGDADASSLGPGRYHSNDLTSAGLDLDKETLIYLFQIKKPVLRYWKNNIIFGNNLIKLKGAYRFQIESAETFYQFLKTESGILDNDKLDQFVSNQVSNTISENKITQIDVLESTDRLALFIKDTLKIFWEDKGANILDFSISIESQSTEPETKNSKTDTVQYDATYGAPEDSPSLNEKVFFRVDKGRQFGPFSALEIQEEINRGNIKKHHLVWTQSTGSWQKVSEFLFFHWDD